MINWSKRSHSSIRCFLVNPRKQTFTYSTLQMLYIVESTGLRSGEFVGHIVGGMKSSTFRSRKATESRARCAEAPSSRKTKTHPGISRLCMAVAYGQENCRDSSLCPIHFDTLVNKCISVLPSFETPTCVIYKFSSFVFNKVVR